MCDSFSCCSTVVCFQPASECLPELSVPECMLLWGCSALELAANTLHLELPSKNVIQSHPCFTLRPPWGNSIY